MIELYEYDRVIILTSMLRCDEDFVDQHGMISSKWNNDTYSVILDGCPRPVLFKRGELGLENLQEAPEIITEVIQDGFELDSKGSAIIVNPGTIRFLEAGDEIDPETGKRFNVFYELKNKLIFRPFIQNCVGRTDAIAFRIDYSAKSVSLVYIQDFGSRKDRIRSAYQYYWILTEIDW